MTGSSRKLFGLFALIMAIAACGSPAPTAQTSQGSATEAPAAQAAATQAPAAQAPVAQNAGASSKRLLWVQPLKGHPVHQLTQIAFMEGCAKAGYTCEVIGTEKWDVQATVDLVEAAMTKGVAGVAVWAGEPSFYPFIEKAGKQGIPVVVPHFPIAEGTVPGLTGVISTDPAEYAKNAADTICQSIGNKGSVAITQGSINTTENLVSESFVKTMQEKCPAVKVLPPDIEGFDPAQAIAKAVAIMQANPDLAAALSTTGGGPTTWAGAQKEANKKIIAIGMDYTRANIDLVNSDQVYAVVGQPLWDESYDAVALLDKAIKGEQIPWWTKLDAPIITKDKTAPYEEMLKKVEAAANK